MPSKGSRPKQALSFDVSKRNALGKLDKSPKGSVDQPICALVGAINRHSDLVTTSTCSGRIVLFESASTACRGGRWLLVSHATTTMDEVEESLAGAGSSGTIALKVEPAILHVQCRNVACAKRLLQVGLRAGFRESGLVLSDSEKVMLAIRTTSDGLELPLVADGARLVSEEYLRFIVTHANAKFEASQRRLAALEAEFARSECGAAVCSECDHEGENAPAEPRRDESAPAAAHLPPSSPPPAAEPPATAEAEPPAEAEERPGRARNLFSYVFGSEAEGEIGQEPATEESVAIEMEPTTMREQEELEPEC